MDCRCCSVLPVSWKRKDGRLRYELLRKDVDDDFEESEKVSVIVGKERRMFVVDPFVLGEKPFRVLMETTESDIRREERTIFVNVDAILFEHMLWLIHNDLSSSCKFSWKEIIDFYSDESDES
ncbi:auxin-responsive protein SAUR78-like [Neltuma alba]|uniref:auxin-responsive protein SAUR78-like n=1 Tax=Neltuma alba TaxID=207710 RepID=UPI0010A3A1AC|nr:auxin-responsive protein SAUR78-like [Prosopis alba]